MQMKLEYWHALERKLDGIEMCRLKRNFGNETVEPNEKVLETVIQENNTMQVNESKTYNNT